MEKDLVAVSSESSIWRRQSTVLHPPALHSDSLVGQLKGCPSPRAWLLEGEPPRSSPPETFALSDQPGLQVADVP